MQERADCFHVGSAWAHFMAKTRDWVAMVILSRLFPLISEKN
ncbi:MAG: hypothetical protein AAFQ58_05880 [Pseudomonadota bacterium]